MTKILNLSRREVVAGGVAAGLVLGVYVGFRKFPAQAAATAPATFEPNVYVTIDESGLVTIVAHRSEMGTGIKTGLPMVLADELEADWTRVKVVQAQGDAKYGDQNTDGSRSTRQFYQPMRIAGASARQMLEAAAAHVWNVNANDCRARNHTIVHVPTGRQMPFGDAAKVAATMEIAPSDHMQLRFKPASEWRYVGKPREIVDLGDILRGKAIYGIDVVLPGMKYAVLSRCPIIGGKVASFDDKDSGKIAGVSHVAKIGDSAVAVVADTVWGAMEGRRVLNVSWDEGPNKDLTTAALFGAMKQAASRKGANMYVTGDPAKVGGRKISAEYTLPFMAHAPMEPGNCTANYQESKCEMWIPTQVPQDCRDSVATAIGLDSEQVKVNVTLMGGGFGRRLEHDYAVEAALVSKAINAPVKVIWTREDDMRFSTYRPASIHQLSATLDGSGYPLALTHRIIAPSISGQKGQPVPNGVDPDLPDEAGPVYGIPNYLIEYVMTETPVPLGWMRSVYALQAAFALESFIDELAVTAGKDPLKFRLQMLSKDQDLVYFSTTWHTARMRGVLQLVAEKAGWDKPLPAGHYRGVACFGCFQSYMAEVVEITMEKDQPRVHRVVAAVDCGQVVNPAILEQQIPGGIVYGLANALRARITIEKGRVVQGNFDDYAPLRMEETPTVEVYAVPSQEAPTGIGEPSVPPVAPALCNAIYSATKKRIRALPILS